MGFVLLVCWLAVAIIVITIGKLADSPELIATGGIMVLLTAMVSDMAM